MKNLQIIDELLKKEHIYLEIEDECYFLLSYTSGFSYDYSKDNSIICNLKKGVEKKKNPQEWKHKENAIKQIAQMLEQVQIDTFFSKKVTFVPIPPSKIKTDPKYDDRLVNILQQVGGGNLDVREIILQKENTESYHHSDKRRNPYQIQENYIVDESECNDVNQIMIVFDDMITTGAHYKAVKNLLQKRFPSKRIKGLFVSRRVIS